MHVRLVFLIHSRIECMCVQSCAHGRLQSSASCSSDQRRRTAPERFFSRRRRCRGSAKLGDGVSLPAANAEQRSPQTAPTVREPQILPVGQTRPRTTLAEHGLLGRLGGWRRGLWRSATSTAPLGRSGPTATSGPSAAATRARTSAPPCVCAPPSSARARTDSTSHPLRVGRAGGLLEWEPARDAATVRPKKAKAPRGKCKAATSLLVLTRVPPRRAGRTTPTGLRGRPAGTPRTPHRLPSSCNGPASLGRLHLALGTF